MILQDIKETKCYGYTVSRSDGWFEPIRQSAISEINSICLERYSESFYDLPVRAQLQFILDASKIHEERYASLATDHLNDIQYQSRRLCYLLHGVRQRTLDTVSLRKRF